MLAEREAQRALDDLERRTRRGEEELAAAAADPERPCDPAGQHEGAAVTLVEPRRGHRPVELLEGPVVATGASISAKIASESTVISGSARSKPWRAKISSSFTMMPLWMPTTEPWRIGWLFATIVGWPFV